ncbi:MAG TPA: hypothetical protein DCW95_08815 [Chryseobacterium sp.]|nr:hypothetical protein [Chryseobacterium sp.]
MKKIYLLAATALTLSFANAQESLSAVSNTVKTVNVSKPGAILYEQEQTGTNGIVSDIISSGEFVMAADDFTLTSAVTAKKFYFIGFQNDANLPDITQGASMYIYSDANGNPSGIPGTAAPTIAKVELMMGEPGINIIADSSYFIFEVDLEAALGSGLSIEANKKYWVTFAPKIDLEDYIGASRWNWSVGTLNGSKAKLVDPYNAFGAGATNWTNISALTNNPAFDGLAFAIHGDVGLGTQELYSTIKPVIATQQGDLLHIFTQNDKLKSADIYATDGKKVASGTVDKLNIGQLPKGVYILNVTLASGKTESTKFIKR